MSHPVRFSTHSALVQLRAATGLMCALLVMTLVACGSSGMTTVPVVPSAVPTAQPVGVAPTPLVASAAQGGTASTPQRSESVPSNTNQSATPTVPSPTSTPPSLPSPTPVPSVPTPLPYNLPPAQLTSATGLYASPSRSEFILPATIPAGQTIYVMGRNRTSSHLRVVWNTGVGWVPVSFTSYIGQRDLMAALPVFEREPPACAEPITTQFGLNSEWISDRNQKIAVIIDLLRPRYGSFPRSSLTLKMNRVPVDSSRREIVEQGQFLLKDIVFTLPQNVQPGDTVGYILDTTSDEPLTFMATFFGIPGNCQWRID